jgi:integrase
VTAARPSFHDCRHTFASLLIAEGLDVVFVARQLGDTTRVVLNTYGHLFDSARHADSMRSALSARFGAMLETTMETRAQLQPVSSGVGTA